ncbi:MAG: ABC transporter ATP-binding protein [Bryobacteraceae bacterium]|jgi:NitT/TauT family transport system ATP-binding protein
MPLISLQNIDVEFPLKEGGSHQVFSGLNLEIEEGEFVSVIGQTGCGKSTLLRLLLGSERPQSGRIVVDGAPVLQPNRHRGYVPQKYSLFPDKTVIQNIAFGPIAESFALHRLGMPSWWRRRKEIYEEALGYLRRVGLADRDAGKYPDQLSGGMQQRVAIAQSLMMQPKILLMDESFSALDPATRTAMQRLLRSIWQESGTTIVFVTHNLAEAVYLGSRVLLIAKDPRQECSRIALDLNVPAYMRRADGTPEPEELQLVMSRLEFAASGDALEEMAEFAG